jgi:hypothetical protein
VGVIVHGDARAILPTLDLGEGDVVITDPPWLSGAGVDIEGAGEPAADLWRDVAALLGRCRAVIVYQSALDPPFAAPPLPFWQTCWLRLVPPGYKGERIRGHVAYVYGRPLRPRGARVFSSEGASHSTESRLARRASAHPCPMSLDHARWIVKWFGNGATRIVDPFAGGGTVLRVAAEYGIEALGVEIDERWIACAEEAEATGMRQRLLGSAAEGWR